MKEKIRNKQWRGYERKISQVWHWCQSIYFNYPRSCNTIIREKECRVNEREISQIRILFPWRVSYVNLQTIYKCNVQAIEAAVKSEL